MSDAQEFFQKAEPLFQQYARGDYAGALLVAETLAGQYPGQAIHTCLWRICLTSRLGRTEEALRLLSEALSSRHWWSESQLLQEPDLEPLQGLPEFEALVATNRALYTAAQATTGPELHVLAPVAPHSAPFPLLLALHGRGHSDAEVKSSHWEGAQKLGWMVALPRSSQLSWSGAYGWDDPEKAEHEILAHYEKICAQFPIKEGHFVMAGFSQGASIAIHLVLQGKLPARGFIAVAPGVIAVEGLAGWAEAARESGIRGVLVVGGKDRRNEAFRQVKEVLEAHKVPLQFVEYPELGHDFPHDFEEVLARALKFLIEE